MAADGQLERLHTRLAAKAVELGGTFYLPYRHHYTAGALTAAYPGAQAFFAAKLRADPHERFSNAWYAAYAPLVLSDAERAVARAEGLALLRQRQEAAQCSAVVLAIVDAAQAAPAAQAGGAGSASTGPNPTTPAAAAASVEALALDVCVRRQHSYSAVMADAALRSSLLRFFANVFTVEPAAAMMAHVEAAFAAAAAEAREKACTHSRDASDELAATAGASSAGAGAAAMPTPTSSHRSEAARTLRRRNAAASSTAGSAAGPETPVGGTTAGGDKSSNSTLPTDVAVFRQLAARLSASRGLLSTARRLQRTLAQTAATRRQITGEAARVLSQLGLGDGGVDGWVAIGDAGRYVTALREAAGIGGRQFVVHDGIGVAGVLERGSLTPVGEFVPINYATARMGAGALVHPPAAASFNGAHTLPPSRATAPPTATNAAPVPPASVDLVTMFQGLHHLHPSTLPHFLASVHAMLRPGGVFIIREHNAEGAGVAAIADLAHSTFNAVSGAALAEEAAEVRAFRPLKAWRALLEAAGFVDARVYECQADDPTVDIMMAFVKVEGLVVAASVAAAAAAGAPSAVLRRAASESGASTDASTRGAARQASATATHTCARDSAAHAPMPDRHAPSSAAVAQVRALMAASGAGPRDRLPAATWHTLTEWLLVDVPTRYGAFLEHTPWFDYPYLAVVGLFWRLFGREAAIAWRKHGFRGGLCNEYTIMNIVIGGVLTAVFVQLAVLAIYPRWATPPESVDTHVQLLVAAQPRAAAGNPSPATDAKPPIAPVRGTCTDANTGPKAVGSGAAYPAWTAASLPDLLSTINNPAAAVLVPWQSSPSESLRLPSRTLLPALDDSRCYAALSVPRYKPFGAAVKALARAGVQVVQVAGQSLMQVRVVVENDAQVALLRGLGSDAEFLFEFTDPATATHREVALAVHVPALSALLLQLEAAGIPLSRRGNSVDRVHLHDF
jgi:SAM-dependent methyltransferase